MSSFQDQEFHSGYLLSQYRQGDQKSLIEQINDYDVYKYTLSIPYPYTPKDADWWINHNLEKYQSSSKCGGWCIRFQGNVVGGIDFAPAPFTPHRAELGYWIGKKHWGMGVMSAAVKAVMRTGLKEFGFKKVTAHVFEANIGSQKVLEKNGFFLESRLRAHYSKDGIISDGRLYSFIVT